MSDPIKEFLKEREDGIAANGLDDELKSLSGAWRSHSMDKRYVYNFDWMGRPIIQYPQDIMAIQEIVWETKPDLIIETGIAHGGSLILSASMLALLDMTEAIEKGTTLDPANSARRVVGVDIDIRDHNRKAIEAHPMASRITMLEGSSIDPDVVEKVAALCEDYNKVMVCLDSMHTADHVLAELDAYAPLVSKGCYCVVFDTFVEDLEPGFFKDRPWDVGNNPKVAVHKWLNQNADFVIDEAMENKLMITVAPDGFLKRIA